MSVHINARLQRIRTPNIRCGTNNVHFVNLHVIETTSVMMTTLKKVVLYSAISDADKAYDYQILTNYVLQIIWCECIVMRKYTV